jgi:hypothetical protein
VACAQRLEGEWISVFGALYEDGIAQSVVRELCLGPQRGTDSTARAQRGLHLASLEAWCGLGVRLGRFCTKERVRRGRR